MAGRVNREESRARSWNGYATGSRREVGNLPPVIRYPVRCSSSCLVNPAPDTTSIVVGESKQETEECRAPESRVRSCGSPVVLVDESAKDVPSADTLPIGSLGSGLVLGRLKP